MAPEGDDRRKRIGLLSPWASRDGGGVFEALVAHCEIVADCGYEPLVFALADANSAIDRGRFGDIPVHVFPVLGPRQIGFASRLPRALVAARLDLLHLHGIWSFLSHAGADWAGRTGNPYVVSPHGMLDPWITGRGKLKKAVARIGYERRSWRRATCFHALTDSEASDIIAEALGAHTVTIPNFVAVEAGPAAARQPAIVYLGRIHPKKNLDALVDGWRSLTCEEKRGHRLTVAGWGEPAHVAAFEARLAERHDDDVAYIGPIYGDAKAALLGAAKFTILASHSEGLPVAILESWAAGTPSLMSRHCHLSVGFERGAALECDTDSATVAAALRLAIALPPTQWDAMSRAARTLADERFSREVVLARWRALYASLLASDTLAGARAA